MRDVDVDKDCPCSSSWQSFEVLLEVHCSEHFGPEVVIFFANTRDGEICMSRVLVKAQCHFVPSHSFHIWPFHVFPASYQNRLATSNPLRFEKCALEARSPLRKLTGVKTHPKYRSAYSANCSFQQT